MTVRELIAALNDLIVEDGIGAGVADMDVVFEDDYHGTITVYSVIIYSGCVRLGP